MNTPEDRLLIVKCVMNGDKRGNKDETRAKICAVRHCLSSVRRVPRYDALYCGTSSKAEIKNAHRAYR
eukprot:scaffold507113_cov83-Attheya_sp.AAC.1